MQWSNFSTENLDQYGIRRLYTQEFVETPVALMTASCLLGYDAGFGGLLLFISAEPYIGWRASMLIGAQQRCSVRFKSGLWPGF